MDTRDHDVAGAAARELIVGGDFSSGGGGKSPLEKSSGASVEDKSTHHPSGGLLRSPYGHESAAAEAGFEAQGSGKGIAPSDLHVYGTHGYVHRTTKRDSSAGHLGPAWVRVHRWVPRHHVVGAASAALSVLTDSMPEGKKRSRNTAGSRKPCGEATLTPVLKVSGV